MPSISGSICQIEYPDRSFYSLIISFIIYDTFSYICNEPGSVGVWGQYHTAMNNTIREGII